MLDSSWSAAVIWICSWWLGDLSIQWHAGVASWRVDVLVGMLIGLACG